MWINLTQLNCTLKNDLIGEFYVILLPQLRKKKKINGITSVDKGTHPKEGVLIGQTGDKKSINKIMTIINYNTLIFKNLWGNSDTKKIFIEEW